MPSFGPEVVHKEGVLLTLPNRHKPIQSAVEISPVFGVVAWLVNISVSLKQRLEGLPTETFSFGVPMLSVV